MRPAVPILAFATFAASPAFAAAQARDQVDPRQARPALVANADGSVTISRAIVPDAGDLEQVIDLSGSADELRAGTEGNRRDREATGRALDEAYEEAVDMARMEAGPD